MRERERKRARKGREKGADGQQVMSKRNNTASMKDAVWQRKARRNRQQRRRRPVMRRRKHRRNFNVCIIHTQSWPWLFAPTAPFNGMSCCQLKKTLSHLTPHVVRKTIEGSPSNQTTTERNQREHAHSFCVGETSGAVRVVSAALALHRNSTLNTPVFLQKIKPLRLIPFLSFSTS